MPSSRNPKHAALWPKGNGKDAAYRNTRPDAHRASPLKSLRAVEGRPAKKGKGPLSKTADLQQVHNDVRESLNELPRVDAEADLQPQVIRDSVAVASLQSQPNQTTSTSAIQSSDQLGDYIARIANLERRLSAVQTEMGDKEEERRKEEEGRRNAERTVADLQRQVKLSNHSNRPLVIPQPKRPRSATWSWAKLEDVLGLNLPTDRSNWKDVHYARKELFLWIQGSHTARVVLDRGHRLYRVDPGATWRQLDPNTQIPQLLKEFRSQVQFYPLLWMVFFRKGKRQRDGTRKPGGSRFMHDWPMKVLLMRTMKNEHDALRRRDKYQQAVREHLSNAKRLGEEEGVLGTNIIRVDASGAPIRETWGYQHDSDASVQDDEEQEVALLVPPKVQNNPLTFGNSHQKSREIESEPQYAARLENERRKAIEDVDGYTWNTMEDEAGDCIQDEDKDESSEYSEKEVCIPAGGKESRRAREPPEDSAEADNRSAGEAELGMPVG